MWDESLSYVQHAYNRTLHSLTNNSPFETCFGYLPKSPMDFMFREDEEVDGHRKDNRVLKFIENIQKIHVVREQLEKSQAKYKGRHDKHRVDHHFQIKD